MFLLCHIIYWVSDATEQGQQRKKTKAVVITGNSISRLSLAVQTALEVDSCFYESCAIVLW